MAGLADSPRWELACCDEGAAARLAKELGVTPLLARVLVGRGFADVASAQRFLLPSLERDWESPLDIPGMAEACERVEQALASGERIAVFGDFDVDGMSAASLLTLALRRLGAQVEPFIPRRFGEGYGLSQEALKRMISLCSPSLVVTVDNGIAAGAEVEWLLDCGIDVVITDHHEPGEAVPTGVPVCDPKLSPSCASRELAGVGVALKMVCELGRRAGQADLWREYTDLATLGTISDMMVLTSENRALVSDGIAMLRQGRRVGLCALAARAGVELASITSDALPFSLIPRLNAAGRMGVTDLALDLLLTDDPVNAEALADELERVNFERREIESQLDDAASAAAERTYDGGRVVVVAGEGWHEGVKGIVASRLVNRYRVPAIVFTITGDMAKGSGRSVGSVDLFHAVEQCSDVLVHFGGHEGAVGVSCKTAQIDEFRRRLSEVLATLPAEQFETRGELAALTDLDELSEAGIAALDMLQPFGQGNKKPLLAACAITMCNRTRVGAQANHLRFLASDGIASVPAIMFNARDIERAAACEELVDLVFEADNETWQGRTRPQLKVRDICYRSDGESSNSDESLQQNLRIAHDAEGLSSDPSLTRDSVTTLSVDELTDALREHFIGDHGLLAAQDKALARLADGHSTLAVMATGRGKSLIFHLHAARMALAAKWASIFVYPLRALVSDQAFHLRETLSSCGLSCVVLTGETPEDERQRIYADLATSAVDIVLTTPEYLAIHAPRFAESGRIGFVVIDEVHHAGTARGGQRSAYLELPNILETLGHPVVLACTATLGDSEAREVCRLLAIDEDDVVIDASVRANLTMRDLRNLHDRDTALAHLIAGGQKCVVYLNSREGTRSLTRRLRRVLPDLGERIAFYHAGLERDVRRRIEQAFRDGRLCCVVATSAFGEGVNVADIRDVVLYQLPFDRTSFNQMSGRAGRDGAPSTIHLLYSSDDASTNTKILSAAAAPAEDLRALYRVLRTLGRRAEAAGDQDFLAEETDIAQEVSTLLGVPMPTPAAVGAGVGIFGELGLLHVSGFGSARRIAMMEHPPQVRLERSVRYTEGLRCLESFEVFRDWALTADVDEMLSSINRPIVPSFGHIVDR